MELSCLKASWGSTRREMPNAHYLQNKILDNLLKGTNVYVTLSGNLFNVAAFAGPVSRTEAKDLQDSIRDVKSVIKRFIRLS